MPKIGTFYHSEDTWSSTMAEAEDHARWHAVDDGPEYDLDDEEDEDEDECSCSDPCCPCSGSKVGVP